MKIFSVLFFLLFFSRSFSIEPQTSIRLGDNRAIFGVMYVFERNNENLMLLASPIADEKGSFLYVVNGQGKIVFQSDTIKGGLGHHDSFMKDGSLFYFDGVLHRLNLHELSISSINIPDRGYVRLVVSDFEGKKIVVASNATSIDVIDLATMAPLCRIQKRGRVKHGEMLYHQGNVIYKTRENEIAVYSIRLNKVLWSNSYPDTKGKLLGITIGTYENRISHFAVAEGRKELYVNTMAGDISIFDLTTGNIRKNIDHFAGDSNNAGLLPTFTLYDLNADSYDDIVAPSVDHNLYAIDGKTLSVIWHYDTDNENQVPVSLLDITGDGVPDVFNVNDYDRILSVVDGKTGEKITDYQLPKSKWFCQSVVLLADYNGNGKLDLIVRNSGIEVGLWEMPQASVGKNKILYNPYF